VTQHRADVPATCADATRLREHTGFAPAIALADGLARFGAGLEAWDPLPRDEARPHASGAPAHG
jgi:nucleoside-diphosphate-sugar epimerase